MTTPKTLDCDLLVAGSGAAGFSAAVTAALAGLKVVMVEKSPWFGGSTCHSAGMVWIPGSRQARAAGITDDPAAALRYLEAEAGDRLQRESAAVYVERGAEILAWFEDHTHVSFSLSPKWPDYHPPFAGSSTGGRSLGPTPFDGRTLGRRFSQLRPPLATTVLFDGMMIGREDLPKFYTITSDWRSALHVGLLYLRYRRDRLSWPRGTRLSNGNALIAMLARTAFERGVELLLETPITQLTTAGGRVTGAEVRGPSGPMTIRARGGVLLACGGFPADPTLTGQYLPHVASGRNHRTLTPDANTGDGFRLGQSAGVAVVGDQISPVAWTPVSLVPQADGSLVPFPHFNDRGKAGYICVDRRGRRFVSEATSYHDFVPAMIEACRDDAEVACWVLCDAAAIRRNGLGRAPCPPGKLEPFLRSGYLKQGATLAELARACGIDAAGLERTVARFNEGAGRGEDLEFSKGRNIYERFNGTIGFAPNPCVAPIVQGPFYAVKLIPGDIGTFVGLRADAAARAVGTDGRVIEGLYVAGNDAGSFMGGTYPGAGTSIGPAMVFGHLAARDVTARLQESR
ncbi:MAG: FAD-dependent oxidoreductase [Gemmatimonadetes bacterium]|nr:FAD-dependent oxidoreductase [Gemmatimonadota bacterium]